MQPWERNRQRPPRGGRKWDPSPKLDLPRLYDVPATRFDDVLRAITRAVQQKAEKEADKAKAGA